MPLHAQPSLFGKAHLLWIKASFSLTIGRKVCSRSKLKLFLSFALQLLSWHSCLSSLARHYEFQGRKKSLRKSELQHSEVHTFRADQHIKDQNSAHASRREECVNLSSCPAEHHFVTLRGRIRSRCVCVCVWYYQLLSSKRTEQGQVQGSRQDSQEGHVLWAFF